jgi:hypothetical protein
MSIYTVHHADGRAERVEAEKFVFHGDKNVWSFRAADDKVVYMATHQHLVSIRPEATVDSAAQ